MDDRPLAFLQRDATEWGLCGGFQKQDIKGDGPEWTSEALRRVYDPLNALSDAASGKYIVENWGYPHANAEAFKVSDQNLIKQYGFDDPKSFFEGNLSFDAVAPALEARMLKEFERIKTGF